MNTIPKDTWQIVFRGKLLPGFVKERVIEDIQQNFSISSEKLNHIFSGDRVVLKKNIPQSEIKELDQKFKARGLAIEWEEEIPVPDILGETTTIADDKDDELLDRSKYYNQKVPIRQEDRVNKFHTVDSAPAYYDFTTLGRLGRLTFINGTLAYLILIALAIEIIIINPTLYEANKLLPMAIFFPFSLFMIFLIFRLAALRFHDFKFTEWFAVLYLFPIINLFIIYFSRLGLLKQTIFIGFCDIMNDYMFYPSLLLFSVLFALLVLVPGTKRKNNYGNKVRSGSIIATIILFSILILLGYFLKDDLALAQLFNLELI